MNVNVKGIKKNLAALKMFNQLKASEGSKGMAWAQHMCSFHGNMTIMRNTFQKVVCDTESRKIVKKDYSFKPKKRKFKITYI